jgi:YhfZ-like protein/regulatory GntR family protein
MTSPPAIVAQRQRRVRKSEELRRRLARQLLQSHPGDPLPPIRTLASSFGASIGATQIALTQLAADGLVTLDSRPGRGGVLIQRDVGRLFGESERMPLLLALSLPSTERINGLATAIRSSLGAAGVETYLTFIRGSRPRIAALAQGRCNVAIMSLLAAESMAVGPAFSIVLTLPSGTFVREHRVFLAPGGPPRGRRWRVGIDRSSFDFERLTELEFGDTAEYVPLNYLKFVREIESGRIDAGILDVDDALMRIPVGMPSRPLSPAVLAALGEANLTTAFVARASDMATKAVIESCLDIDAMVQIQDDVIAGRRPPEY